LEHETRNTKHETDYPLLLIVEDNADLRHYIRGFLRENYSIIECGDGKAGFEKALEAIPDLVISDVMMPGMDGYELCTKLKTDERTSHIPVIMLTAKASLEDRMEGLETGADDFLTKPFQPMELLIRIRNLIRQRQVLREKFRKEFEHIQLVPEAGMGAMEVQFMEKARKVINENLSNPEFGIQDFSQQMNMSRVQLHRKLNALFNLSATAFIRTYRLNAAARLFESRAGNVAQVAYEVGFNNLSYFSRCFQKQFGVKPSEYPGR
jgi:DNA-binding response OmpR family regulator